MDIKKRTLTEIEETVIKWQLKVDINSWVTSAVDGKINNCKKRMIAEWTPRLMADSDVESIPANEDKLIELIVARDDYKDRVAREKEKELIETNGS